MQYSSIDYAREPDTHKIKQGGKSALSFIIQPIGRIITLEQQVQLDQQQVQPGQQAQLELEQLDQQVQLEQEQPVQQLERQPEQQLLSSRHKQSEQMQPAEQRSADDIESFLKSPQKHCINAKTGGTWSGIPPW